VKFVGRNSENRKIGDVFTCKATTIDAMIKWMVRLDSAHQKGQEIPFHRVLIEVGDASTVVKFVGVEF
jgi:hypothetical protein